MQETAIGLAATVEKWMELARQGVGTRASLSARSLATSLFSRIMTTEPRINTGRRGKVMLDKGLRHLARNGSGSEPGKRADGLPTAPASDRTS